MNFLKLVLALVAAMSLLAIPAFGHSLNRPLKYTLPELLVLDDIGGFGDIGTIDPSTRIVAPHSSLGFSLKFSFANRGPYWTIRQSLLPSTHMGGYDIFSCDLYVQAADPRANLTIFLRESSDDRWICWSHRLKQVPIGRWIPIRVARRNMTPWNLGNPKPDWNKLDQLAIEPSGGKAVFYLDNVRLEGSHGARLEVFNTRDDGLSADPNWHEPIRVPAPGSVILPGVAMGSASVGGNPRNFMSLLGNFATTGFGAPMAHKLAHEGIGLAYYSPFAQDWPKYLTRRQAWDVNARGESPNYDPFHGFVDSHTIAVASPSVVDVGRKTVDALVKSGIGAWMVVDYVFPWADGPWGYAPVMLNAYRRDLKGADAGLHLRYDDGKKQRIIHFVDYFKSYNGFYPEPTAVGLTSWQSFAPPRSDERFASPRISRARWAMFLYLRSYEWLKLPDKVGRYYQRKGGDGLWIVPNPESIWGSSDYLFMTRIAGVHNLFPEWFGNAGDIAQGAYAEVPYLRQSATASGSHLSEIFETGVGGHSAPYWDWRVAYNTAYVVSAVSGADDLDDDFLDESTYSYQSDPAHTEQFTRFRDGISKALAFEQGRAEHPKRPAAKILCISERAPAQAGAFADLKTPYSLAPALSRAHLLFDLRDSLDLTSRVLNRYRIIAYCPSAPRVGDLVLLRRWLAAQPGRVLLTHTFVPTRDTAGFWGLDTSARLGRVNGGAVLGLGRITVTNITRCQVVSTIGLWSAFFKPGRNLNLPTPMTRCQNGVPVVMTNAGPLVTQVHLGKGALVYLHFATKNPLQRQILSLDEQVVEAVAAMAGVKPVCQADLHTTVQVFKVRGGRSLIAWDALTLAKWHFWKFVNLHQSVIPALPYQVPEVNRTIRLPVTDGQTRRPWLVYDFWADKVQRVRPRNGFMTMHLRGSVTALWYFGPDSAAMRATIQAARKTRRRMESLQF